MVLLVITAINSSIFAIKAELSVPPVSSSAAAGAVVVSSPPPNKAPAPNDIAAIAPNAGKANIPNIDILDNANPIAVNPPAIANN